jgi:hypothetical protein
MCKIIVLLSLLLCSCDCQSGEPVVQVGVPDEGFQVADDGTALKIGALPFSMAPDWTVQDAALVPDIVGRWRDWLIEAGYDPGLQVADDDIIQVTLSIGYVPSSGCEVAWPGDRCRPSKLATSNIQYARDGTILGGEIVLSSDYDYSTGRDLLVVAGCHEVGHVVYALADDPGPPRTVDLRSIMAKPYDPLGRPTKADIERITPFLPSY